MELTLSDTTSQSFSFRNTYTADVVVVCHIAHATHDRGSFAVRVYDVTRTGFSAVLVQYTMADTVLPDLGATTVYCLAVQEGEYAGVSARRLTVDGLDKKGSWGGSQVDVSTFTTPAVVGQVLADSATPEYAMAEFWARGASRSSIVSSTATYVGAHTGEGAVVETPNGVVIGYLVFEAGAETVLGLAGSSFKTYSMLTPREVSHEQKKTYTPTGITFAPGVVASFASMYGNDGGWPGVWIPAATTHATNVFVHEDTMGDTETNHTTESLSIVWFELPSTRRVLRGGHL
jgi:hypothetical protein